MYALLKNNNSYYGMHFCWIMYTSLMEMCRPLENSLPPLQVKVLTNVFVLRVCLLYHNGFSHAWLGLYWMYTWKCAKLDKESIRHLPENPLLVNVEAFQVVSWSREMDLVAETCSLPHVRPFSSGAPLCGRRSPTPTGCVVGDPLLLAVRNSTTNVKHHTITWK